MAALEAQIAHIWRRLGFGPTKPDIDAGVGQGAQATISQLLGRPLVSWAASAFPADQQTDTSALRQLELMAFGPVTSGSGTTSPLYNPAQERISWILQGLVVVGIVDSVYLNDMRDHISYLRAAMGSTYRQLLLDVSGRSGMLKYLSGYLNTRDHPNENYARELLELFSIGRVHPITGASNYGQVDITEIARALSGWQYNWNTGLSAFNASQWDPGSKTFLGANRGAAGLNEVVGALVGHQSWPYYIPARFYREITGLVATPEVLSALAPVWGQDGNIAGLVSAIANRPEFLSDQAIFSKVKTPVELLVSATRLLAWGGLVADASNLGWLLREQSQHPFSPPNVSGWPKGDQWLNATNLQRWCQVANGISMKGFDWSGAIVGPVCPSVTVVHGSTTAANAASFVVAMAGLNPVSPKTLSALMDYATSGSWTPARAAGLLNLLLLSPEFLAN